MITAMDVVSLSLLVGGLVAVLLLVLPHITTIVSTVHEWIKWAKDIKYLRTLPSPPRHWLLGHMKELNPSVESLWYMQRNHVKHPRFCVYWLGPVLPMVFTADTEILKRLLLSSGDSPKPRIYTKFIGAWFGDGLAISDGQKWKRHRKMLTPAFHADVLKQYTPLHNGVSFQLLDELSKYADSGEPVNIEEYTHPATLDVLLKCMFSYDSNCLEERHNHVYLQALDQLATLIMERFYTPHYANDMIYYATANGRKFLHYCNVVHKFSENVIKERRQELLKSSQGDQPTRKYQDFLDILLSARDENGVGLTDQQIREEADTFLFVGHDTTATALDWALYCLAKYQDHQELCRNEIREVLADRDSDEITWDDLSKLNYIWMCARESMRLYPVVSYPSKLLSEDFKIDEYTIPKGTWVAFGIFAVQHDAKVWTDPEKFDPQRFSVENSKKMDPFSFVPFSAGPRNCIGQRFAMIEMKITIAHILNKYQISLDPDHAVEGHFNLSFSPKHGVKLRLKYAPKE